MKQRKIVNINASLLVFSFLFAMLFLPFSLPKAEVQAKEFSSFKETGSRPISLVNSTNLPKTQLSLHPETLSFTCQNSSSGLSGNFVQEQGFLNLFQPSSCFALNLGQTSSMTIEKVGFANITQNLQLAANEEKFSSGKVESPSAKLHFVFAPMPASDSYNMLILVLFSLATYSLVWLGIRVAKFSLSLEKLMILLC